MSVEKARHEAHRWLTQAQDDLEASEILRARGKYAQACFLAQQAAEKASKAVWYALGEEPWGHSVLSLIRDIPDADAHRCLTVYEAQAAVLDQLYIPTRYPNGLPDLTPSEVYRATDAERGLTAATAILEGARQWLENQG